MLTLAIKNIIKNKNNSLIIIMLITIITALFFLGNTIIGEADNSVRKSYIESLTGEVIIQKKGDVTMNLFGANAAVIDEYFEIPVLPSYDAVTEILQKENDILSFSSLITGSAILDYENFRHAVLLNGIDAKNYFELFPGIKLRQGNFIKPDEAGIMITEELAQSIQRQTGNRMEIGTPLLLTTGTNTGFFKIRELPVTGIFRYENPGQFMNDIVILDSQTVRELNSIRIAEYIKDIELPDIDSIFNDDYFSDSENDSVQFNPEYLMDTLSIKHENTFGSYGDYYFILIRLKKGVSIDSFISNINKKIDQYDAIAVDWRIASGTSSILALLVQYLYNTGIILICITGIIAIINILLIFVFRRFKEIGTLRAIGAKDSFIRKLIYTENLIYSGISSIAGIIIGYCILLWINSLNIKISNDILITLFNGNILHFNFIPSVALSSFVLSMVIGFLSSVYPVEFAVKIKPIVAVQRG